jgi:hypothetical protein
MSHAAFGVFRIRYSGNPAGALWVAVRVGEIPQDDLPPIIADLWTRHDWPTADLGAEDWVEVFRMTGFFSCPPLAVRRNDAAPVPCSVRHGLWLCIAGARQTGRAACRGHATRT